jgi:hypothetical protein
MTGVPYLPCPARFEPDDPTSGTHSCCLRPRHEGRRHLCPICGGQWQEEEPLLMISPAVAARVERLLRRPLDPSDRLHVTRQGNKNEAPAAVAAGQRREPTGDGDID